MSMSPEGIHHAEGHWTSCRRRCPCRRCCCLGGGGCGCVLHRTRLLLLFLLLLRCWYLRRSDLGNNNLRRNNLRCTGNLDLSRQVVDSPGCRRYFHAAGGEIGRGGLPERRSALTRCMDAPRLTVRCCCDDTL